MDQEFEDFLILVKKYHEGQTRNNGKVPYWQHCVSTAEILEKALDQSGEITDLSLRHDLMIAALGHDLLEDTTMDLDKLRDLSNDRVADLVFALTNTEDDFHRAKYMEKMAHAPEEAWLVKMSDLVDNTASCAYGIADLTKKWVVEFYLPILKDTEKELEQKEFTKYPQTAEILKSELAFSKERLYHNIEKY